jgi:hypothetical protein
MYSPQENEVTVGSWTELNETVYERSWNEELGRYRPTFAFHGLADASQPLMTSLERLGGAYEELEPHILRNFGKYAARDLLSSDDVWGWLTLGQHYGLPTRLLDWTFSPQVAMHFATCDPLLARSDGVIWCVDYARVHQLLPGVFREQLEIEGADLFTIDLLSEAARTTREFDELASTPFLLFFEPPSIDQRIVNQAALFSVMSSARAMVAEWLGEHPDAYFRVVIPSGLKQEVRDKLDQANVNERLLFPGLEGLTRWLRRYYAPRLERVPTR